MPSPQPSPTRVGEGVRAICLTVLLTFKLSYFSVVAMLGLLGACSKNDPIPPPPSRYPSFSLKTLDGHPIVLAVDRDRVQVINVWATWCKPCRKELPSLQVLAQSMDPARFSFMLISVDDDDHVPREYLRDHKISLTSAWDPAGNVVLPILGIDRFPYTILVNREGEIVSRIAGERVWHTQSVVKQLEALYVGDPRALKDLLE